MKHTIVLFNPHGGHSQVPGDDGIGSIRSRVQRSASLGIVTALTPHNTTESWDEYLKSMDQVGMGHMAVLGVELEYYTSFEDEKYKGEMIMLLPPELKLMRQVKKFVLRWNDIVVLHNEERGLRRLFATAKKYIDADLYSRIVWYWPHPYSVDSESRVGRLLVHAFVGKLKLSSPEMRNSKVYSEIHAIEVLNAAHPGRVNRKAMMLSHKPDFAHMAKMAGADDHHDAWVGSAYSKVKVKTETSEGILEGIKNGYTIPMSGLGVLSETNWPFMLWSMLVPIKGVNVTGGLVGPFLYRKVKVK